MKKHASASRQSIVLGCHLIALTLALTAAPHAEAAIYKCVDLEGNTSYSSTPCPSDQTLSTLSLAGNQTRTQDCNAGKEFASLVVADMRSGKASGDVFQRWGGLDTLSPTTINLVSYVYTFDGNKEVRPERITALTNQRCESGSFGPSRCVDFPYAYQRDTENCRSGSQVAEPGSGAADRPSDIPSADLLPPINEVRARPSGIVDSPVIDDVDIPLEQNRNELARASQAFTEEEYAERRKCQENVQARMSAALNNMMTQQDPSSRGRVAQGRLDSLQQELSDC